MLIAEYETDGRYVGLIETPCPTVIDEFVLPEIPPDFYIVMELLSVSQAREIVSLTWIREYHERPPRNLDERPGYHSWMPLKVTFPDGHSVVWAITTRKPVHKHWLMGVWYGYPECCIAEHIRDVRVAFKDNGANHPITQKRRHNHPYKGAIPCMACLTSPYPDFYQQVIAHRSCPIPFPKAPPGYISWFGALARYLEGTLKPWGSRKGEVK